MNERAMYRKRLFNMQEERTKNILNDIANKYDAQICPKIKVADVLEITNSGLSYNEYSYALMAHFDFVVMNKDCMPEFAVEFDGLQHKYDAKSIYNDELKNNICRKLNLPLLRITSEYFENIGRFPTILNWIIELYFLRKAFDIAQDKGEIPLDEPWMWFGVIGYDPVVRYKAFIEKAYEKGLCCDVIQFICGRSKSSKSYATLSTLKIQNDKHIVNFVECFAIYYFAIPAYEISVELSEYNIYKNFKIYLKGNDISTYTDDQVLKMRNEFVEKHDICSFNGQLNK